MHYVTSKEIFLFCILLVFLFLSKELKASIEDYYPYKIYPSASNYGNTGILELPNSRFMEEATLRFNFSSSFPNEFTSLTASPFPWLETTYRYVEIKDQNYGPSRYSGNQSLKDKGFDVKVRLFDEGRYIPSTSIGIRDIAGTALFSSEYLVFTKRFGNFDITSGLGWGLLGMDDNIGNPFESLNESYKTRSIDLGQGGSFSPKLWFSGTTSLLGGIEYDLHKYGLKLKLEYDTTRPEIVNRALKRNSRFNLGINYYLSESIFLGAAFERGDQFRLSFAIRGNFLKDTIPKPKPKNVISLSEDQKRAAFEDKNLFFRSLNRSLRDEAIYIQAANYNLDEVDIAIASTRFQSITRPAGRAARIASALSIDDVKKINVRSMNGDLEVAQISIHRQELDEANIAYGSPLELLEKSTISSKSSTPLYENADFIPTVDFPEFNWTMSPSVRHQIGGPEGFYLGQLFWKTDLSLKLRRNLIIYSSIGINLYDTFDGLNNPSFSTIPKVRSDIQEYLKEGKNNIGRLQAQYFFSPMTDLFFRADLGLLEEMFGGFGGEVLYRPIHKKFSYGFSLHRVKQRGYDQRFSFKDYETTTGHFGLYFDLPREINAQLLIGKYLAGDKGATLNLSRRFESGFTLGIFATKTNLSAEEFGEGSFDKGFYLSIPTKLFYPEFTSGFISFGLHPLTKDGGAFLHQLNSLYSIMGGTNQYSITRDWKDILD